MNDNWSNHDAPLKLLCRAKLTAAGTGVGEADAMPTERESVSQLVFGAGTKGRKELADRYQPGRGNDEWSKQ